MRNGTPLPQPQQLNPQVIEDTKRMMAAISNAQNPQVALAQMIQNNPNSAALANMLKGNGSLESIARQMARERNIDIISLINSLMR